MVVGYKRKRKTKKGAIDLARLRLGSHTKHKSLLLKKVAELNSQIKSIDEKIWDCQKILLDNGESFT